MTGSSLEMLMRRALGSDRAALTTAALEIDPALTGHGGTAVSRATFAMALTAVLFDGLLERVPSGRRFGDAVLADGRRIIFDHGALRTVRLAAPATGGLPGGTDAFRRILEPLGYRVAGTYPLPRLRMTGFAFAHVDLPEAIAQFFVSELHVDRFDEDFAQAAERVFGASRDPLSARAVRLLDTFARQGEAPLADALDALPDIVAAFDRQHGTVSLADYETLLAQSAEAAWIATEGNCFNHATHRVPDVEALADRLRAGGWPIKDKVEVSATGRVRQTAFRADTVEREFATPDGALVKRVVPGSFYEFISRDVDPSTGAMDLAFDSSNATGIFAMTRVAA